MVGIITNPTDEVSFSLKKFNTVFAFLLYQRLPTFGRPYKTSELEKATINGSNKPDIF
jgi:hypothetical protein